MTRYNAIQMTDLIRSLQEQADPPFVLNRSQLDEIIAQLKSAREEIEKLRDNTVGFIPTAQDRRTLAHIKAHAPANHHGNLMQRLAMRALSVTCPARSAECAIRKMCTNKCGDLDPTEQDQAVSKKPTLTPEA